MKWLSGPKVSYIFDKGAQFRNNIVLVKDNVQQATMSQKRTDPYGHGLLLLKKTKC